MSGISYFPVYPVSRSIKLFLPAHYIIAALNTHKPGPAFDLSTPALSPFITGGMPGTDTKISAAQSILSQNDLVSN
jgi:hypothetical protein